MIGRLRLTEEGPPRYFPSSMAALGDLALLRQRYGELAGDTPARRRRLAYNVRWLDNSVAFVNMSAGGDLAIVLKQRSVLLPPLRAVARARARVVGREIPLDPTLAELDALLRRR